MTADDLNAPAAESGGAERVLGLRVRLTGLPEEVAAGADVLAEVFEVVEVSKTYPSRGASRNVSAYLQVRFTKSEK
jgi:hypothetical protein